MVQVPLTSCYLWAPGTQVPLTVRVNGARARLNCSAASTTLSTSPSQTLDPAEPSTLALATGTCAYYYSSYATPMLTSIAVVAGSSTVTKIGALTTAVSGMDVPTKLQLNGTGLGSSNGAADYSISIGGSACTSVAVAADGSSVTCSVPALPAGNQPLQVAVAGKGYGLMPAVASLVTMSTVNVTYSAGITTLNPASISFWGGTTVAVTGYGFGAPLGANGLAGMAAVVNSQTSALTPKHTVTVISASATQVGIFEHCTAGHECEDM